MNKGNRLDDLTRNLYFKYKRSKFTEKQIAKMYGVGPNKFVEWKKENGIPVGLNIRTFEAWEIMFPKEVEKMKQKYLEYERMGWKLVHIGEALNMSEKKISQFKNRYFPEKKNKERYYLTDEEMEIAKSNGLSRKNVSCRLGTGWTLEQAINRPKDKMTTRHGENKHVAMWRKRKGMEGESC